MEELKKIKLMLKTLDIKDEEFEFDLKIIRGLDYYTGTVVETFLVGNEKYGSICSGGRYDNLAENYTSNKLPGVGISIGLTRLFFVLKEIGFIDSYTIKNKLYYLIIPIGETIEYCTEVMVSLEKKGYGVNIYFEEDSLKKKITYADKLGIEKIIIVGDDEVIKNIIKVKNMKSGKEISINYNNLP